MGILTVRWREKYGDFLKKPRGKYQEARIICRATLLEHDAARDRAIDEVCRNSEDDKASHFMFRRNGKGTISVL